MIEVENLTKSYGSLKALDSVSFKVEKGQIVGLLGPNGAGKTTMMRILTGYFSADSGSAKMADYDISENPMEVKRRVGYMTENPLLYTEMTVQDYLGFIADIKEVPVREKKNRIDKTMEETGISDMKNRVISRLSRGYKQRVGLAQALIHNPEVLVLDEPTVGLDPKQIIEIRELIKSLTGQKTIILSTHILPEASMICERIVVIDKGKIVAVDTQEDLIRRLKGAEKIYLEVKGNKEKILQLIQGVKSVKSCIEDISKDKSHFAVTVDCELGKDVREDIFRIIAKNDGIIYEMRSIDMSLEEVFLRLTTTEQQEGGEVR